MPVVAGIGEPFGSAVAVPYAGVGYAGGAGIQGAGGYTGGAPVGRGGSWFARGLGGFGGRAPHGYTGLATNGEAACCGAEACSAGCLGAIASCGCGGVGCGSCSTSGYTYAVVGQGKGNFVQTTEYKYVGAGAGDVAVVPIPSPGCSCWWSLCCLWLLLLPLLLLPSTTTTTTTTSTTLTWTTSQGNDIPPPTPRPTAKTTPRPTPRPTPAPTTTTPAPTPRPTFPPTQPPQGPQGQCLVYGDPHVTTFDGSHASFYSQGEYWIVRSQTVWIQGRYMPTVVTNGLSVVKEIAIGGPFLRSKDGKKNVLRISALAATWNGAGIIPGFPDQWSNADPPVEVVTDGSGEVLQPNRNGKPMHVVHVKLPLYITLQINRWNEPGEGDYINTNIVMSKQPAQDGHCGNFNGNSGDDTRPIIRSRIGATGVAPGELLFHTKTPVRKPERPDLNDCPTDKANHARAICASKNKNGMASKDCMIDVCFGGDQFAEHDAEYNA